MAATLMAPAKPVKGGSFEIDDAPNPSIIIPLIIPL
jgi:hypothetical protein